MGKGKKPQTVKTNKNKHANLFENTPRNYKIGGNVLHKRDVTRFVKWPKYIVLQRQKRILYQRLKVPAVINQFTNTLSVDKVKSLFKLLGKYKPETKAEKKLRLKDEAEKKKNKQEVKKEKPMEIKFGLNHVTTLIENRLAKLVVIAHDVDPIELVLWLPHLCRSKQVPYCFVKSKSRLGQFVHQKKATCLALTGVKQADKAELERLTSNFVQLYNNNEQMLHKSGDLKLGIKATRRIEIEQKRKEAEIIQNS